MASFQSENLITVFVLQELSNYDMGDDSVFLPNDSPKGSNSSADQRLMPPPSDQASLKPPVRPPKPPHLAGRSSLSSASSDQTDGIVRKENYANSQNMQEVYLKELKSNASSQTPVSSIVPYPPTTTPIIQQQPSAGPAVSRELKPGRISHKSATLGANQVTRGRTNQQFATLASTTHQRANAPPVPRALKPKGAAASEFDLRSAGRVDHFRQFDFSSIDDLTCNSDRKNSFQDDNQSEEQVITP